jgi:CDP-diacylglycerol--glycerol-3-phosphate 3-phosphatidyltransferase
LIPSRHIPNLVTMSRLVLAVAAFGFLGELLEADPSDTTKIKNSAFWAFWFFLVAAISDFLDGWLARRNGWVTAFGRVADPVVDKVLTLGALIYMGATDNLAMEGDFFAVVPVWAVVLLLAREFLVTALRGLVESHGLSFGADGLGKLKLILQVVYIAVPLGVTGGIPDFVYLPFLDFTRNPYVFATLTFAVVGLTVLSGLNYCVRGVKLLAGTELK